MAEPTSRFRLIPNTTAAAALDDPTERKGAITDQSVITTGLGNGASFGTIDISAGAANSAVLTMLWDITADGGNTTAETFKIWLSSNDFDQIGSVIKYQALSGADKLVPSATENYIVNAVVGDYTWGDMPEDTAPVAQNAFPSDEGASMALSTTSDDAIMWAMYAAIASGETTGSYAGTTSNYEFQFSFRYSYS